MKKKALSLLLACTMAFSSFSMALAAGDAVVVEATQSNEQMAGDFLKAAGVLKGDDKGNLNLDQALTREQAMLMIAKLMGKEDEALNFKGQSTFKDAKNNAYWAPVIAWAEAQKLTNGMGDGTFGLGKEATKNQVVTMYLRVLGYEVTWAGKELSADSQKVVEETGLLTAVGETFNRGAMAVMTVNTLKATPKGAETTLAKNLNVDMTKAPKFVTPSKPGEIGDAKVESAKAIANNKIEVKFDKEVNAAAADFKVTEKADATKVLEVKEAKMESAKVAVLTVEGLTSGKAYSVKVGENTVNFTGIGKVATVPTIKNVKGTDFNRVEIEFSGVMDKETAETVANYVIEKATVVKATLNADRNKVTLETEGLAKNTLYKMTIDNVKSADAVAMKKVSKTFRATEDTIAPKVLETKFLNNETIEIKFNESMNKAALEDVANYKIPNLEVVSAKASEVTYADDTVTLKTATQDVKVSYTLTVEGLKDASVKGNALAKFSRTFRGVAVDTTAPVVTKVTAISNTLVKIEVSENNLMDATSVADVANYAVDRDVTVVSAELVAGSNKYGKTKEILVTTSAQESGNYKLTVKGIMDEFGNALKAISGTNYRQYAFTAGAEVVAPLKVASIQPNGLNKIVVTFDKEADKTTAQDPTNYVFNKDLGAATKATLSSDAKSVTLETATQKAGTQYTVTINGVQYKYVPSAVTVDVKANFVALATEADLTAPTLSYAYAPNKSEVHLVFSEAMKAPTGAIVSANAIGLTYVDMTSDDTTMVFKAAAVGATTEYTLTAAGAKMTDLAGNAFKLEADTKFYGSDIENAGPTISDANIEQVNANKIKLTFDKNIQSPVTVPDYVATRDEDDHNVLYISKTSGVFEVNKEILIDLVNVKDMVDVAFKPVNNSTKIKFTPYMSATEAPVMTNAVAVNNKKVELTFNEPLSATGSYKIEYINTDGKHVAAGFTNTPSFNTTKDKVILTLSSEMKATEVYYVKYLSAAVNLGGKSAVTKDFEMSFNGTAVQANSKYIAGVSFDGNKTVVVYDQAGNKITPSAVQVKVGGNGDFKPVTTTAKYATGTSIVGYFQQENTYKVIADIDADNQAKEFEFKGILSSADTAKGVTLGQTVATTAGNAAAKQTFTLTVTTDGAVTGGATTILGTPYTVNAGATPGAIAAGIKTTGVNGWTLTVSENVVTFERQVATNTAIAMVAEANTATTGAIFTLAETVAGKAPVAAVATTQVTSGANADGTISLRFADGTIDKPVTVTVTSGALVADVAKAIETALKAIGEIDTKYAITSTTENVVVTQKAGQESNATISLTIN